MKKKLTALKAPSIFIILIILLLLTGLSAMLTSCGPPSLAFEPVIISSSIDKDSSEPISPSAEYDINTRQIYATIKYKGVMGQDSWRFKWIYKQTGEIVLDNGDKYNASEPDGYFQGIVTSNIFIATDDKIIPPGNYTIQFYHNGKIKGSADFSVNKPKMTVIDVTLANKIDERGAPVSVIDQFKTSETAYACIKTDYVISGNTFKAFWKDSEGNIINEASIEITEDYYEESYIWFNLELESGTSPVKPGNYSVEILLNNVIVTESDFEVIQGEPVTFEQGITYTNDKFGFAIDIPDGWTYEERPSENMIMIEMTPEKNDAISFAFIAALASPIKPYDEFAKADSESFAEENQWTQIGYQSRDYGLGNGTPVKEVMYLYQDANGNQYVTAYSFIEYNENVYVLYATADYKASGDITEAAYYGILDSLILK